MFDLRMVIAFLPHAPPSMPHLPSSRERRQMGSSPTMLIMRKSVPIALTGKWARGSTRRGEGGPGGGGGGSCHAIRM